MPFTQLLPVVADRQKYGVKCLFCHCTICQLTRNKLRSLSTSLSYISKEERQKLVLFGMLNSYNSPANPENPRKQAVAGRIKGDKCSFYQCSFVGLQETLWDDQGRHYFYRSTIVGAVDFIFGAGQSIYERCTISVSAGSLNGVTGFITAQGRTNPADTNGFVFKECNVTGTGKVFLGRPWRDFARVLYFNSNLSDIIVPRGWDPWNSVNLTKITFAEHGCSGAGSDTRMRVRWEKNLSDHELQQLTSISFIDNEGWISLQPIQMLA